MFIIRHDEQGTLGLILNRPTSLHMGRGRGGLPLTVEVSEPSLWPAAVHGFPETPLRRTAAPPCHLLARRPHTCWQRCAPCKRHAACCCRCALQGMESMREAFGASPLYCGGFKAQQVRRSWRRARVWPAWCG